MQRPLAVFVWILGVLVAATPVEADSVFAAGTIYHVPAASGGFHSEALLMRLAVSVTDG
jgi:hypothetical protein